MKSNTPHPLRFLLLQFVADSVVVEGEHSDYCCSKEVEGKMRRKKGEKTRRKQRLLQSVYRDLMPWTTSLKGLQKDVDSSGTSTVVAVGVESIDHSRIGPLPLQTVIRLPRVIEYRSITWSNPIAFSYSSSCSSCCWLCWKEREEKLPEEVEDSSPMDKTDWREG